MHWRLCLLAKAMACVDSPEMFVDNALANGYLLYHILRRYDTH